MKKLYIIIFLLIINVIQAQTINSYGLKVGVVGAKQEWNYTNFSTMLFDETKLGMILGGYIEWFDIKTLSIITELNYIQKGATQKTVSMDASGNFLGEVKSSLNLDYLSIPILLKLRTELSKTTFFGIFGTSIDLLVNKSQEYLGSSILNEINTKEFSFTYGIGFMRNFNKYDIGLEFRNSRALDSAYSTDLLKIDNSTIDISLILKLN